MKNYRKNKLFISIFLSFFTININCNQLKNRLFIITIPKAGSHLIEKLIDLIHPLKNAHDKYLINDFMHIGLNFDKKNTIENAIHLFTPSYEILEFCLKNLKFDERLRGHLTYQSIYEELFKKHNFKTIFIFRDPRDQLISRVFFTIKLLDSRYKGLKNYSVDELLLKFIGSLDTNEYNSASIFENWLNFRNLPNYKYVCNIDKFYRSYLPWMESSVCHSIRFEDIVGSKGKGNDFTQRNEIHKLANFLQINIDDNKLDEISNNLFGNTNTFREGQIGSWKKYFSQEHKTAFKKVAGDLLIELGYESNYNW